MNYNNPITQCMRCKHVRAILGTSKTTNKTRWIFKCGNKRIKHHKIDCGLFEPDADFKLKPYFNEYGF